MHLHQAKFKEAYTSEWLPAQVPGSVHTDLLALDRIPDPFVADNELSVQWVTERNWEYQLTFQAAADLLAEEHIFLVCDGLDTFAHVKVNDMPIGHAENMFRQYRWEVTSLLTEDENTLHIRFPSTVAHIRQQQEKFPLTGVSQAIPGGPYVRKAPSHFGWDWGPQLPPTGIWKDVRIEGYTTARIEDVHIRQQHSDNNSVILSVDVALERWQTADVNVTLKVTAPGGTEQTITGVLKGDTSTGNLTVELKNAQLWWPNGYGDHPLYKVKVILEQNGNCLDSRDYKVGLRTLELRQEPDEFGTSFTFVVNGVPVFAKGANWIPADSFPTRISDEHLTHLIRSAADANMNMLRVWGGGFYEEERFYDLCDTYGILVWQDFIFACSIYPDDDAFFENVRVEAIQNIRRLRHRASLALWCGNNEMEGGWADWGWAQRQPEAKRLKAAYDRMYHHLLPDLCAVEDPDHAYWPSSPSSGVPFDDPNGTWAGDTHNWMVWHGGQKFAGYREHNSRFVSEFGFQSLPVLRTISTYAPVSEWNMTSYLMEHHQRNASGNGKIINYMTDHFRMPKDFPSLVYLTQILQAEAVRTGVEYWRRNRACTSGTLYWQLNDCWPVASWASLDYFGRWKALHYSARRFYAPVLLSAEEAVTQACLYVTSDLMQTWTGIVHWVLETLDGKVIVAGQEEVVVPALSAMCILHRDFGEHVNDTTCREIVLVYELWQDEDTLLSRSMMPFIPSKHLALTEPYITHALDIMDGQLAITLTAQTLASFVWLDLIGTDVIFSDNAFDLPAKRTVTVTCPLPEGWDLDQAQSALQIRSLKDSF
ncbi:MAG: glycoside hydrolase family 2 protein [Anaerolineae bacterium]|nr:glycoside hydrolase family 2 protein [Anaerolineae bacterium]